MAAQKTQAAVGTSAPESPAARPRQPQGGQQKKGSWDWAKLEIVHRNAAGIDVGSREHWVAIGADRDPEPVRRFGCFTGELHRLADWLV